MKRFIGTMLLCLGGIVCMAPLPVHGQVALVSPEDGATLQEAPTFSWRDAEYDFYLFSSVFFYDSQGRYYPFRFWMNGSHYELDNSWWNLLGEDKACYWAVLGYNTETRQYAWSDVRSFTKSLDTAGLLPDTGQTACYDDNGDGTVTDNVTGLTWQQTPQNVGLSWQGAVDYCESLELAGHGDWRMPTSKELFSISDFSQGWPYL